MTDTESGCVRTCLRLERHESFVENKKVNSSPAIWPIPMQFMFVYRSPQGQDLGSDSGYTGDITRNPSITGTYFLGICTTFRSERNGYVDPDIRLMELPPSHV